VKRIKCALNAADISHMIISDDQARLVASSIRAGKLGPENTAEAEVEPEVLDAVREAIASTPDLRTDRMEHAKAWLEEGDLDPRLIAEKMMCRIMSDWLR